MSELTNEQIMAAAIEADITIVYERGKAEARQIFMADANELMWFANHFYTKGRTASPSQWEVDFNEVLRERNEALAKIAEQRKMMEMALAAINGGWKASFELLAAKAELEKALSK